MNSYKHDSKDLSFIMGETLFLRGFIDTEFSSVSKLIIIQQVAHFITIW